MNAEERDPERLSRALEIALQWRESGGESAADVLARHPDLSDLLSPMLTGTDDTADEVHGQVGDFAIDCELGRGSMGAVYAAHQQSLGRRVALKLMHGGASSSERQLARFRREAVLTARLDHPNVVRLLEFGVADERPFFAMELVDGAPLSRVYQAAASGQPFHAAVTTMTGADASWSADDYRAMASLGSQIARGLHHAHEHGVVHRDVKPSNILIRPDGVAQLADFGIARERDVPSMTATGEFAGTPHYVSPEQVRGDLAAIDGRSDVFSLGATLYEGLTHRPPFDAESSLEVVQRILDTEPRDPRAIRPGVPKDLAAIVMKALEKAPDDRYRDAADFADDLEAFVQRRPVRARPISAWRRATRWARRSPLKVTALGLAIVASLLGSYLLSIRPDADLGARARFTARIDALVEQGFSHAAKGSAAEADRLFRQAVDLDPQRDDAWVGWALSWLNHEQPDDALRVVEMMPSLQDEDAQRSLTRTRAIVLRAHNRVDEAQRIEAELGPCRTDFEWFAAGMEHLVRGHATQRPPEYVLARQCLDRAIALADGPNALFQSQRAHVAGHLLDRADAEMWARILLDQWPDSCHAAMFAAFALAPFDRERSLDIYRRVMRFEDAHPLHAYRLSAELKRAARIDEAVDVLRSSAQRWPQSGFLWFRLGEMLLSDQRPEEAREALQRGLDVNGPERLVGEHRGLALMRLGRFEEARSELEARTAEAPRRSSAWVSLSLTHTLARDFDGGAEVLARAVAAVPENPDLHLRLGSALHRAGRLDEACTALRECVAVDPGFARAHELLSRLLLRRGKLDEAIEVLDQALQLPNVRVSSICRRANIHRLQGEFAEARTLYERAEATDPDYADAYYHRARLEAMTDHDDLAAALFRRAVEKNPELIGPARDGARFFDERGDIAAMREFYQRAVELQPRDASLHQQVVESLRRHQLTAELQAERTRWTRAAGK